MKIPPQTIIKYIRKGNKTPYGVIVAVKRQDGEVSIDYALCKKGDRFTKAMALEIAIGRAISYRGRTKDSSRTLPRSIAKEMNEFDERAAKYYRTTVEEIYTYV